MFLFFYSGNCSGRFRSILSDNLEKYLVMLQVSDSIIATYLKSTTYLIISPLNGQRWVMTSSKWILLDMAIMEIILFLLTFLFQSEKCIFCTFCWVGYVILS